MLAKFGTNSGGITWWSNFEVIRGTTSNWPNLEPMQVAFYLAGEITQVNTLGPLQPMVNTKIIQMGN